MKTEDKIKAIIQHFGLEHQQRKLAEEHFELQQELCKKEFVANKSKIASEIADNFHLLYQIMAFCGIAKDEVIGELIYKVNRTYKIVEGERNDKNKNENVK